MFLKITNWRVYVFSGVGNAQTVPIDNINTSLVEILARFGGIPANSKSFRVKIIRGDLKKPVVRVIDLYKINKLKKEKNAIIIASSQNPRQFIQRRGRVLRFTEGKYKAVIYDCIVSPAWNNNFTLSGLNLAFLGYFANKEVYTKKILFHWPDGIWLKRHIDIDKMHVRFFSNRSQNGDLGTILGASGSKLRSAPFST